MRQRRADRQTERFCGWECRVVFVHVFVWPVLQAHDVTLFLTFLSRLLFASCPGFAPFHRAAALQGGPLPH